MKKNRNFAPQKRLISRRQNRKYNGCQFFKFHAVLCGGVCCVLFTNLQKYSKVTEYMVIHNQLFFLWLYRLEDDTTSFGCNSLLLWNRIIIEGRNEERKYPYCLQYHNYGSFAWCRFATLF